MPRTRAQRLYDDHLKAYRLGDFREVAEELHGLDPDAFRLLRDALNRQHGDADPSV